VGYLTGTMRILSLARAQAIGLFVAVGFASLAVVAACNTTSTLAVPGKPTAGTYEIDFPTIGAAIASKSVSIYVWNADDSSSQCVTLLDNATTLANLPAPLKTISTSACSLDAADSGALALPYGDYAVLVLTAQAPGGAPFLRGCAIQTVSAEAPTIDVEVSVANNTITVPAVPSGCAGLESYCAGGCQ
jgi:hypothetical protein